MSGIEKILHRRRNWADVERLVSNREPETASLEFKALLTDDVHEVRRDACAMANAQGGVIVYGIHDDEDRAAGFTPLDGRRVADRLRETLGKKIEPELTYEAFPLCSQGEPHREVVILRVEGDGETHAVEISPGRFEFWQRRDTSKREMTYAQIRRGFDTHESNEGVFQQQLNAMAAWELRSLPARIGFECQRSTLEDYLGRADSILSKAGRSARSTVEAAWVFESTLTDAIRRGGFLGNYRLAAEAFISLLPGLASLATADKDRDSPTSQTFDRVVEFGDMLSYEGNRRLGGQRLLITLGASVMGRALRQAVRANAADAQRRALSSLREQARHYSGELAGCFEWALEDALSGGDNVRTYPPLLREMEDAPDETLIAPPRRR